MHCPNISGYIYSDYITLPMNQNFGSFYTGYRNTPKYGGAVASHGWTTEVTFAPNRSSIMYGASHTVQPLSIRCLTLIRT